MLQRVIGIALIHPQILKIGAHAFAQNESALNKDTSFRSLTQYFIWIYIPIVFQCDKEYFEL